VSHTGGRGVGFFKSYLNGEIWKGVGSRMNERIKRERMREKER
jgi:hypothetical protein